MCANPIYIIGLGIPSQNLTDSESAQFLLPEAAQTIEQADCLVGGRQQLNIFKTHKAQKIVISTSTEEVFTKILQEQNNGKKVVILANGDPLCFGIGKSAKDFFGINNVCVFPNTSSLQAVKAFLGISVEDAVAISLHGRDNWDELAVILSSKKHIIIFTDAKSNPQELAKFMLSRGADLYDCHIVEDLQSTPTGPKPERYIKSSVQGMLDFQTAEHTGSTKTYGHKILVVLKAQQRPLTRPKLMPGQPDFMFASHKNAIMSNFTARSISCSVLRPEPNNLVWDLGAGSGAMSIELCSRVTKGKVIAVEKHEKQLANLYENRRLFSASHLVIIENSFPECLKQAEFSEKPDRIFIGGGFGPTGYSYKKKAIETITLIWECLKPGGRLVANCVLLESMILLYESMQKLGHDPQIMQVNTNQAVKLAGGVRFVPDNPLFILAMDKPLIEENEDDILSQHVY